MKEVIDYHCPILNEYMREKHLSSLIPSAGVLVKFEDYTPYNPDGIICPMSLWDLPISCFIKTNKYIQQKETLIKKYRQDRKLVSEIKAKIKKAKRIDGNELCTRIDKEIEKLKKQELASFKDTLCILVNGFKKLK